MQQRETSDKKNLRKSYDKVNSILPKTLPYITYEEAKRASRLLVSKFGKLKDASPDNFRPMYKKVGVKKVWVCLSGDPATLHRGWRRLVHDLAHRIFRYRSPSLPDHCQFQADFEAELVAYVNKSGWLEGGLKPKIVVLSNEEKRLKKIEHLQFLVERWQRKQKIANTFIRKYHKKLKYHTKK
jgi:hypothetical protein